jgi:hypothetical protein
VTSFDVVDGNQKVMLNRILEGAISEALGVDM